MSIIGSLRDYILTCPLLEEYNGIITVRVDYADSSEPTTYTIEEGVTSNPIIKRYTTNKTKRQYLFILSSIQYYGSDIDVNMMNLEFYEKFSQWIEDNNNNDILPTMDIGKEASSIEVLTNGYIFDNAYDVQTSRYQIQCRLTYYQD